MANKRNYCLGFIFTSDLSEVFLIRKQKPEWQKGLLNGIGGKIEAVESPLGAMQREGREESGHTGTWEHFGFMGDGGKEWICHNYYSVLKPGQDEPHTCENEQIERIRLADIPARAGEMIDNLPALVFAALLHLHCIHDCPKTYIKYEGVPV